MLILSWKCKNAKQYQIVINLELKSALPGWSSFQVLTSEINVVIYAKFKQRKAVIRMENAAN